VKLPQSNGYFKLVSSESEGDSLDDTNKCHDRRQSGLISHAVHKRYPETCNTGGTTARMLEVEQRRSSCRRNERFEPDTGTV